MFNQCQLIVVVLFTIIFAGKAEDSKTVDNFKPVSSASLTTKISLTTIKSENIGDGPINPTVKPSTVKPDPDKTTTPNPLTTTTASSTTKGTTPTTSTVTPIPPVTTPTTAPTKSTSATTPIPVTTPKPNVTTTIAPATTIEPKPSRQFDGPSFIGGIVLATGLMAIGFVAFKFYKARTERNYHTL